MPDGPSRRSSRAERLRDHAPSARRAGADRNRCAHGSSTMRSSSGFRCSSARAIVTASAVRLGRPCSRCADAGTRRQCSSQDPAASVRPRHAVQRPAGPVAQWSEQGTHQVPEPQRSATARTCRSMATVRRESLAVTLAEGSPLRAFLGPGGSWSYRRPSSTNGVGSSGGQVLLLEDEREPALEGSARGRQERRSTRKTAGAAASFRKPCTVPRRDCRRVSGAETELGVRAAGR